MSTEKKQKAKKTEYGTRVQKAMDYAGLKQEGLAMLLGIKQPSVYYILFNAKESKHNSKIASGCGVSSDWLSDNTGDMLDGASDYPKQMHPVILWDTPKDLPTDEFVTVDSLDVVGAAGSGHSNSEWPTKGKPVAYRTDWIKNSKAISTRLMQMIVEGVSMEPFLMDEDSILVDLAQNEVINGKVFAFVRDGAISIKRLYLRGDTLVLSSDNKSDPTFRYDEELIGEDINAVNIIGRVVDRSGSSRL